MDWLFAGAGSCFKLDLRTSSQKDCKDQREVRGHYWYLTGHGPKYADRPRRITFPHVDRHTQ